MKFILSAVAVLALTAFVSPSQAQSHGRTWGQPWYGAYAQPSPLSETRPETHARIGAAGGGHSYGEGPVVYRAYGHDRGGRYGWSRHGHRYGRYDRPSQPGYRDEWGYNDDRPPSRRRSGSSGYARDHLYRECGCSDVYLYDR